MKKLTFTFYIFICFAIRLSYAQQPFIPDSNDIKFNVKMLFLADNFQLSQWSKAEVLSYINWPMEDEYIFLKSTGFKNVMFIQFRHRTFIKSLNDTLFNSPLWAKQDSYQSTQYFHINHPRYKTFVVGVNVKTGEMYRLQNFSACDFGKLFNNILSTTSYKSDLKLLKNKKSFTTIYSIENVDLGNLYDKHLPKELKKVMSKW